MSSFMKTYFKKKNNMATWQNSNQTNNKRKYDDVDVAVKKLKSVLIEKGDLNKSLGKDSIASPHKSDCEKGFPSITLKGISFMSKCLGSSLCHCTERGISIFQEDFFQVADLGCITLLYADLLSAAMQRSPFTLLLTVSSERQESLKKDFRIEPWSHFNFTDKSKKCTIRLNCADNQPANEVEAFYKHLCKHLKTSKFITKIEDSPSTDLDSSTEIKATPVNESVSSLEDNSCTEIDSSKEVKDISVHSFYGLSNHKTGPVCTKLESSLPRKKRKCQRKCKECGKEVKSNGMNSVRTRCLACEKKLTLENESIDDPLPVLHLGEPCSLFQYPPPPSVGRITFSTHDLQCLEPEEFFNDVNIDFYLKFFHNEILSSQDKERTHIFSSFFYSHMTSDGNSRSKESLTNKAKLRHQRVRNWTRNVDIFSKDFIIVPINQNYHWFLAIICFPSLCIPASIPQCSLTTDIPMKNRKKESQKANVPDCLQQISGYGSCSSSPGSDENKTSHQSSDVNTTEVVKCPLILIFDSLAGGKPRWDISSTLRQYLQMEWNEKKKDGRGCEIFSTKNMKGCVPKCPQQSNNYDCGPYLLLYVQHFFVSPIQNFTPPIKKLCGWFSKAEANTFRKDLKGLVQRLTDEEKEHVSVTPANSSEIAGCSPIEIF